MIGKLPKLAMDKDTKNRYEDVVDRARMKVQRAEYIYDYKDDNKSSDELVHLLLLPRFIPTASFLLFYLFP